MALDGGLGDDLVRVQEPTAAGSRSFRLSMNAWIVALSSLTKRMSRGASLVPRDSDAQFDRIAKSRDRGQVHLHLVDCKTFTRLVHVVVQ
jgi:hypothetical protein